MTTQDEREKLAERIARHLNDAASAGEGHVFDLYPEEQSLVLAALRSPPPVGLSEIADILFPNSVKRPDGSFVEHSADENLEAALIDIEGGRCDAVCINTIKKVVDRLTNARAVLSLINGKAKVEP